MRYPSFLVVLLVFIGLLPAAARGQSDDPIPAENQKELRRQTDAAVEGKRIQLASQKMDSTERGFYLDTFRVQTWDGKCHDYLEKTQGFLSTVDMLNLTGEEATAYDSLLNKYYRKLSSVLKGEDKKTLIQAQRAWLAFRDAEAKLIVTVDRAAADGHPGTMASLSEASTYCAMIYQRMIDIYSYYHQMVSDPL